jgi:crossover junction endodeoxyribonuclease RusA
MTKIIIPGKVQPKERPRKGQGHWYTPTKTRIYEEKVAAYARSAQVERSEEHLEVMIFIYWPDLRRRDIDNGVKSILDALNGIAWRDDSQIVDLLVCKRLDRKNPRALVVISEVEVDEHLERRSH